MNLPGVVAILFASLVGLMLMVGGGRARQIGGICLLIAFAAAGYFIMRDRRIATLDEQIRIGDPQGRVLSLLGAPTAVTDCSTGYGGYVRGDLERREIPADCAEEFWYYSFYFPQSFTYTFDHSKTVIRKYELNSP